MKEELTAVTDLEQLKRLLKLAAKVDSIVEFEKKMR